MNGQIYPTLADVLTYLKGLKRRNLVGAAFGSYGWGGEAVRQLEDWLRGMKVDVVTEGVKARYVPDEAALTACRSLGEAVAARLSEHAARDANSG
jgi:flavorubredoxin